MLNEGHNVISLRLALGARASPPWHRGWVGRTEEGMDIFLLKCAGLVSVRACALALFLLHLYTPPHVYHSQQETGGQTLNAEGDLRSQ